MKILEEYVIILNILLFLLLLYNFIQKLKIIEGHSGHEEDDRLRAEQGGQDGVVSLNFVSYHVRLTTPS